MNKKFFNGRRKRGKKNRRKTRKKSRSKRKTRKKRGGTITDAMRARWEAHIEKDRRMQIAWEDEFIDWTNEELIETILGMWFSHQ